MNTSKNNLFLIKVRKEWPALYWFSLVYILGVLICAFIIKSTVTPFFVFPMYSFVEKPTPIYESGIIEINGYPLAKYNFPKEKEDIIVVNYLRYIHLKHKPYNDMKSMYLNKLAKLIGQKKATDLYEKLFTYPDLNDINFGAWLKRYLEKNNSMNIFSIKIYRTTLEYTKNGEVKVLNKVQELSYQVNVK